jgi:hypothetical protein
MNNVQNPSNSEYNVPLSEPFRINITESLPRQLFVGITFIMAWNQILQQSNSAEVNLSNNTNTQNKPHRHEHTKE